MPQLVNLRSIASDNTLGELHSAANSSAPADSVLCSLAGNPDEADARVLGTAVVLAVAEVTKPCLEGGGVVLLDAGAVGLNGSGAGDGGPLAGVVEESEVDVGVLGEVVGLAGLGVGVEDEVDAVVLLRGGVRCVSDWLCGGWWTHPGGEGHASAGEQTILGLGSHHAELALVDEGLEVLDLLLEGGVLDVLCGVRVGGLSASLSV